MEYIRAAKDDQIYRFAETFGLDETNLRNIMKLHLAEDNINEFDRYGKLKATADSQKVKQYFEKEAGEGLSLFKANSRFDNLLRKFILTDGFDL